MGVAATHNEHLNRFFFQPARPRPAVLARTAALTCWLVGSVATWISARARGSAITFRRLGAAASPASENGWPQPRQCSSQWSTTRCTRSDASKLR